MMRALGCLIALVLLAACAPAVQRPLSAPAGFAGPRIEPGAFVAHDGARLPLSVWVPEAEPWAVIIGLHGMNEDRFAFHMAAPWWAERGVAVYAYDQRGFGAAPGRGIWAGEDLLTEDLRTLAALVRQRHPDAVIAVMGESMGGAVAVAAFASDRPPDADRVILSAPAVRGWSAQPWRNRAALWVAARLLGSTAVKPPEVLVRNIRASDNTLELLRLGRSPGPLFETRFDALHGLVDLMERASAGLGRVRVPLAYLYGANDQIIEAGPTRRALRNLPAGARTAWYAEGWHLLTRSHAGEAVMADVEAFLRDPSAAWPSGAPPITFGE